MEYVQQEHRGATISIEFSKASKLINNADQNALRHDPDIDVY